MYVFKYYRYVVDKSNKLITISEVKNLSRKNCGFSVMRDAQKLIASINLNWHYDNECVVEIGFRFDNSYKTIFTFVRNDIIIAYPAYYHQCIRYRDNSPKQSETDLINEIRNLFKKFDSIKKIE